MVSATKPEPLVRVAGLRKVFGRHRVLEGLALEVHAGEAVALLGANGAGKTTLLKILATLVRPTRGAVTVAGHDCASDTEGVRRAVGLVAHSPYVYDDLTALENLRFWTTLAGQRVAAADLVGALASVELERFAGERVPTLDDDRAPASDIARITQLIASNELENATGGLVK